MAGTQRGHLKSIMGLVEMEAGGRKKKRLQKEKSLEQKARKAYQRLYV